jgi:hypothetical protein
MTTFNPVWRLKIDSVEYTDLILANLTITSGRTDIYSQAVAGYVRLTVINLDQTNLDFQINANVSDRATRYERDFRPNLRRIDNRYRSSDRSNRKRGLFAELLDYSFGSFS